MIVVISDLHFDTIAGSNLSPAVYRSFMGELYHRKKQAHADVVDLVLAGDIFELSRSWKWFTLGQKPYASPTKEAIWAVTDEILTNQTVAETLSVFRAPWLRLHYIPGNHDRLVNHSAGVRKRICQELALDWDASTAFPDHLTFGTLHVTHGHQWDPYNIGLTSLSPSLGEVVTHELAARIPYEFQLRYLGQLQHPGFHRSLYKRMLDFDILRPKSAMLPYLLNFSSAAWQVLHPIIVKIARELNESPVFKRILDESTIVRREKAAIRLVLKALASRSIGSALRWPIHKAIEAYSNWPIHPQAMAPIIEDYQLDDRLIISGHTHYPEVQLIGPERYYVNCGTWKDVIHSDNRHKLFQRTKSLTYTIYNRDKFTFWTGQKEI